jgi:hypothetical protein
MFAFQLHGLVRHCTTQTPFISVASRITACRLQAAVLDVCQEEYYDDVNDLICHVHGDELVLDTLQASQVPKCLKLHADFLGIEHEDTVSLVSSYHHVAQACNQAAGKVRACSAPALLADIQYCSRQMWLKIRIRLMLPLATP